MDVEQFRLPTNGQADAPKRKRPPRHKAGERFLKGPIPLNWLAIAARLPGKSLHVGVAIWHLSGLSGQATVRIERSVLKLLGIGREACYRALHRLESAALVDVDRKSGRRAVITIREAPQAGKGKSKAPVCPRTNANENGRE